MGEVTRRKALVGAGGVAALLASGLLPVVPAAAAAATTSPGPPDPVAATYLRVLLRHTRWAEQQFDRAAGIYPARDFTFAVVLGNALLLTRDGYDATAAGVDQATLKAHTLATIEHFAASNLLTGGTEWGRKLFFDTTFQSYFLLAARLLWTDLDDATRDGTSNASRPGKPRYTTALGTRRRPGLRRLDAQRPRAAASSGDTKLEEMGVYAQSLAPALAWAPGDARAKDWRDAFGLWSRNEGGLPAADLANPRLVDGVPISANTATNLYDTFLVENHGSFGPHYQEELWRTSGRNAMHFLAAGTPLPEVLTAQPNGELLWRTMLLMTSDAGEPLMPMVADREHLYGRDVIPLAFRAQVLGDRHAARAEADLAARLEPYQAYAPADRITKFSGEPKYEPEARAELAISYLLHEWRANQGPVKPVTTAEFDAHAAGVADFGAGPGLLAHRSPAAWAATVTKPGFVKFAWQPHHDDWLFVLGGANPMLLPATNIVVKERHATTYAKVRDGFDGTVGVLRFDSGYAALATLPTGAAVYASTGVAEGEGVLNVYNLAMPGVPGLDGNRTYTAAEGKVTIKAQAAPTGARTDDLTFAPVTARHVRMLGVQPDPQYGYSLWAFEVRDGDGPDLAPGGTASASSASPGKEAKYANDGDPATRWAVSTSDRPRADSWLAVDLGAPRTFDRVRLSWEAAAGRKYRVETSARRPDLDDGGVLPGTRPPQHRRLAGHRRPGRDPGRQPEPAHRHRRPRHALRRARRAPARRAVPGTPAARHPRHHRCRRGPGDRRRRLPRAAQPFRRGGERHGDPPEGRRRVPAVPRRADRHQDRHRSALFPRRGGRPDRTPAVHRARPGRAEGGRARREPGRPHRAGFPPGGRHRDARGRPAATGGAAAAPDGAGRVRRRPAVPAGRPRARPDHLPRGTAATRDVGSRRGRRRRPGDGVAAGPGRPDGGRSRGGDGGFRGRARLDARTQARDERRDQRRRPHLPDGGDRPRPVRGGPDALAKRRRESRADVCPHLIDLAPLAAGPGASTLAPQVTPAREDGCASRSPRSPAAPG